MHQSIFIASNMGREYIGVGRTRAAAVDDYRRTMCAWIALQDSDDGFRPPPVTVFELLYRPDHADEVVALLDRLDLGDIAERALAVVGGVAC